MGKGTLNSNEICVKSEILTHFFLIIERAIDIEKRRFYADMAIQQVVTRRSKIYVKLNLIWT